MRALRVLEAKELSVGELANTLQLPQSTVSRHLKVMMDGGWLNRRTVGTATLYRMILDDLSIDSRELWLLVRKQMGETPKLREDQRRLAGVIAERKVDSQAFFGRVAGEWDELRARLFGTDFTLRALLTLLPSDWVVADLGCGTGNAAELLAPNVERVVAVDLSDPMLEAARKRLKGCDNVQFAAGPLEKLPLKDKSVDAAVCVLVLHHVQDPLSALREMRRILRTDRGGGTALVVDMVEHNREEYRHTMGHRRLGFPERGMKELLKEAGFDRSRVQLLSVDIQARGPGLFAATGRVPIDERKRKK